MSTILSTALTSLASPQRRFDSNGQLVVTGTVSDKLTVEAGSKDDTTGVYTKATDTDFTDTLFGSGTDVSDVAGGVTSAARSSLIQQFNDVRDQIDHLAKDAGFNGTNLLGGDKLFDCLQ